MIRNQGRLPEKKQAANKKWLKAECDQKRAELKDTAPGIEDAGVSADAGPQIANNIVMPAFPLQLGQMLAQCTAYSKIDMLEPGSVFLREEMSDSKITDRVFHLRNQIFSLVYDERQVTAETWGRLSVFSLKPDLWFLHQLLEANEGRNCMALVMIAKEARARILLWEMAQFGVLHAAVTRGW